MDLALSFNPEIGELDLSLDGADLASDASLASAVLLSLMCDATARPGELASGEDRRGFWGDAFTPAGDDFGSRLWLLAREKQLPAVVNRARDYAQQALRWLVDDGLATRVDVAAFVPRMGWLVLDVAITLRADTRRYRFEWSDAARAWTLAGEMH